MSRGNQQTAVIAKSVIDSPVTMVLRAQLPATGSSVQGNTVIDLEYALKSFFPEFSAFKSLYQQVRIMRCFVDVEPLSRYNWPSAIVPASVGYDFTLPAYCCYQAPGATGGNDITNLSAKLFNRDDPFHVEFSPAPLVGSSSTDLPWVACVTPSQETYGKFYLNNIQATTIIGSAYPTSPTTVTFTVQFRLRT